MLLTRSIPRSVGNVLCRYAGTNINKVKTRKLRLQTRDAPMDIEYEVESLFPTNKKYFQNIEKKHLSPMEFFAKTKKRRAFFGIQLYGTTNPIANTHSQTLTRGSSDPLKQMTQVNTSAKEDPTTQRGRPWDLVCNVYGFRTKMEALVFEHYWNNPGAVDDESLRRRLLRLSQQTFGKVKYATEQDRLHGTAVQTNYLKIKLQLLFELLTHPKSPFYRSINDNTTPVSGPLHLRLFSPEYKKLCLDIGCPVHLLQKFEVQSQQEMRSAPEISNLDQAIETLYDKDVVDKKTENAIAKDHLTTQIQVQSLPPWFGQMLLDRARISAELAKQKYSQLRTEYYTKKAKEANMVEREDTRPKGKSYY